MKITKYPAPSAYDALMKRPAKDAGELNAIVSGVLDDIRQRGDDAVREYELRFDKVELADLQVSEAEMEKAEQLVSDDLKQALEHAHSNIEAFHRAQQFEGMTLEVQPGVTCSQKAVAIERVGLYIPGGTAPLFSTVLMLATPAKIAGCKEIVLCTPPAKDGSINPAILVAARIAGVSKIFKIGGVQAIGAMAYGTASVPKVYKIFGPGNQFVTCAKQHVSLHDVAIDMPAGPSEVCVLADETSHAGFVAADLLSQAEHGVDSQVVLITTSETFAQDVEVEVERQLNLLPRKELARQALENSHLIVVKDYEEMMALSNLYAPEHLIIETKNYRELSQKVVNAGSVFMGPYTPESAGDYASGTNHTLPTSGYATAYSGVNLDSFVRKITFQEITAQGVRGIAPTVELMAEHEMLDAHCNAMRMRRLSLENVNS